jgi:two-component system, LuxR family, sensor kinase FixL
MPHQANDSFWPGTRLRQTVHVAAESGAIRAGFLVFVGYYFGARIGFALTFHPHPVSVLWPPNSILVAALLLTPPRIWWFILLAAFPAHCGAQLQNHVPPLMILCWFISNSCEALIGASLTRYLLGGPIRFSSLRNASIFCLCVVFAGPFLSSFLDAAFVVWNHWGQGSYWELIRIRLFSNVLAALVVVPLIVTWATDGLQALRTAKRARWLEGCLLLFGLLSISFAVLYKFGSGSDSAFLFLPLPFLLWAAVRFGALGASTATSIVGFLAIWSASHGHGPFSGGTAEHNALSIQIFLIVLSIPVLLLATVIEERAIRETELRESEERMRLAADAASLGIWEWDLSKNEIWATNARRALLGWPASGKITFEHFLLRLHPDDRSRIREEINDAIHQGKDFDSEYRLVLPDGIVRWMATRGTVHLDANGKAKRILGISIDITTRKQAELDAKQRREELSHLSRVALLGEMTASIAHELNQPLSGIISNASAGQRFIDRGDTDVNTLREILVDVDADAHRAHEVIRNIRNTVKKGAMLREPIDLNFIVTKVAHMVQPDMAAHCCELVMSLSDDLAMIEGDPVQINQVIVNLVTNAFDAMRDTPAAHRKVQITTERNGDGSILVSVRDYGAGIPEEVRERLFDQFVTTKEEGLGMGLTIARSIIEAHAGTITGENAEGGGARFYFTLPVNNLYSK